MIEKPLVSVIIPCRNEYDYIEGALNSLLSQKGIEGGMEILVADGLSDDGTTDILRRYGKEFPQVRIFENKRKKVPFALQQLLKEARGDLILRADAHCIYPENYVATLVKYLVETGADNVGGVWHTVPGDENIISKIIASCLSSRFGVGISYRSLKTSEPIKVETVPFGAWRSDHFKKFGAFDEKFLRAQDLEHNIRVKQMGGEILCLPWLKITYFARSTFKKLKVMAFQYGYWKIPVKRKHHIKFSLRQYFPPLLVIGTVLCLVTGFLISRYCLAPIIAYLLLNFLISAIRAVRDNRLVRIYLYVYTFLILHYYYGFGYLLGYWDVFITGKRKFDGITR